MLSLAYGKNSQEASSSSVTQAKWRAREGEVREVDRVPRGHRNFTQRLGSCLSLSTYSSVTLGKLLSFFVPQFVNSMDWGLI